MPTLFRLLSVIAALVGLTYGGMFAIASVVQPQQREIVATVALPQNVELRTGRSVAESLNSQASALVRHKHRN